MLCGRDKFTRKQPHRSNSDFRKRKIIWKEMEMNLKIKSYTITDPDGNVLRKGNDPVSFLVSGTDYVKFCEKAEKKSMLVNSLYYLYDWETLIGNLKKIGSEIKNLRKTAL